ncbi:hypothetical protein [Mesorhizobium sp.]|uniref:hypothetical protein n=1 Tax=Mesorhizobium sp. TaxID=1871066 RepID=UPI0025E7A22A|nr:hypothetical protein [Mesorhizobium sp.]
MSPVQDNLDKPVNHFAAFLGLERAMKRVIAITDRAAFVSLKLLVVLNALFLTSFLVVALLAAGKGHAGSTACAGADILSSLDNQAGCAASRK